MLINHPHLGPRDAAEFVYLGDASLINRPDWQSENASDEFYEYLYLRDNTMGVQKEWWYHNSGCGMWFLAERHTRTSEVLKTYQWSSDTASGDV